MMKWYAIYEGWAVTEKLKYAMPDCDGLIWANDHGKCYSIKCDTVECAEYCRSSFLGPVLAANEHDALDGIRTNPATGLCARDLHDINGKPWIIAKEMKPSEVKKLKKKSWYLVKLLENELGIEIDTSSTNHNPTNTGLQAIVDALVSKKIIHGELK